jgi:hypothetical protein
MRLKPDFTGFLNNRLVMGLGIASAMFIILLATSSFKKNSDRDLEVKQVNLLIRQIGHRLLLQSGDSTSRVLPVSQKGGTFLLTFEKEFVFNHDSLMMLSHRLLPKTQFPSGYTVTVHDCKRKGIVYGFQLNNTTPDILACSGRSEPAGCYMIEFSFPDFNETVDRKKEDIGQTNATGKDSREANVKPEESKSTSLSYNVNQQIETAKLASKKLDSSLEESQKKNSGYPLKSVVFGGMLVLLCVGLLIGRFGKTPKPVPIETHNHTIVKESVPVGSVLGKFLFDVKNQRLVLGNEVIGLTDKEAKVLELLHKNFGELISRDTLMQEVWINEGVITGRSLDMFISKLRKKLSADADLRITNIHGRGYRLEVVTDVTG